MTTGERLIRNMCQERTAELQEQQQAEIAVLDQPLGPGALPDKVRRAVATVKRLGPKVAAARAVIKRAGFDVSSDEDDDFEGATRSYRERKRIELTIRQRYDSRRGAIAREQTKVIVETLALRGAALQQALMGLRKRLEQI